MSSFLSYRGRGCWCSEGVMELIAALLYEKLGDAPSQPWLDGYRQHLLQAATSYTPGYTTLGLDAHLTEPVRLELVLNATKAILTELASTYHFSKARLLQLPRPNSDVITGAMETTPVIRYVVILMLALEGRWRGDESFTITETA